MLERSGEREEPGGAPPGGGRRERSAFWRLLPLLVLALATGAAFAAGLHRYLTLEALLTYRDTLQTFVADNQGRALASMAVVYVGVVALSIPGAAFLSILSGFLFGWFLGGLVSVVSATIGAILVFSIARTSFGDFLLKRAGPRLRNFTEGFRREAFSYILFLRFLPVVPFWLVNLAAAAFGVRLKTFALATMIGVVPVIFTFATAGAGLEGAVAAHRDVQRACEAAGGADCGHPMDLRDLITPKILIAFAALGVLSLVPVILRRRGAGAFGSFKGGRGDA
jgi:uncharacterized membrane protein YdjX (TVP38/TMEM64 family)